MKTAATPLRARLREAAREAVLESAEAVFSERGIQTAKVEEIAERAGVSVGTLYNYFGDRQGLLEALLESEKRQLLDKADQAIAASEGRPFEEQLEGLLDVVLAHFHAHRRLFTLLVEDEISHERAAMRRHRCVMKEMIVRIERLTKQAVKSGLLSGEHADLYAAAISGTIRGVFMRQLLMTNGAPVKVTGAAMVSLFMDGARSRP